MDIVKEAFPEYKKPSVAVDTVIVRVCDFGESTKRQLTYKKMQVLLVRKATETQWHLPGTIMRLGETSLSAISRITQSSLKIDDIKFEQLYTIDNDVYRDERGHIISIVYIGMYNDSSKEASKIISSEYEAQWFWVNKSRTFTNVATGINISNQLEYDHGTIINDTITRLKERMFHTDDIFRLVKDKFTIRELENTFEAINENPIAGFRRIIANKIEGTGIMSTGNAFRPAELYVKKQKQGDNNE